MCIDDPPYDRWRAAADKEQEAETPCDDGLAHPRRTIERHRPKLHGFQGAAAVDLQDGDIDGRIVADELRGIPTTVEQPNLDL